MADDSKYVRPEEACRVLKVSAESLKRWAKSGKIDFVRTSGGHRRYNLEKFLGRETELTSPARKCVCYARVSSSSQKEDLERQVEALRIRYPNHTIIRDVGSGISFKRKGLKTILGLAFKGQLQELVVTYKDRLCRFGFELFSAIVKYGNGKIVVLNREGGETPEQELCQDLLSIVTVFSARIHGFRSGKNRKAIRSTGKEGNEGEGQGECGKDAENKDFSKRKDRVDSENPSAE